MCNKGGDSLRRLLTVPKICVENVSDEPMDKYTAGIELSNACRQFYVTRLKAAGKVKERLGLNNNGIKYSSGGSTVDYKQDRDAVSKDDEILTINGRNDADTNDTNVSSINNSKCTDTAESRIKRVMEVLKNEMVRFSLSQIYESSYLFHEHKITQDID